MPKVTLYEHPGRVVAVKTAYKGKHRDISLCYLCDAYRPDEPAHHCHIASTLHRMSVLHGGTAIRQEFPSFLEKP